MQARRIRKYQELYVAGLTPAITRGGVSESGV
jgi:hypothetical protein